MTIFTVSPLLITLEFCALTLLILWVILATRRRTKSMRGGTQTGSRGRDLYVCGETEISYGTPSTTWLYTAIDATDHCSSTPAEFTDSWHGSCEVSHDHHS